MHKMRSLVLVLAALLISGCATTYNELKAGTVMEVTSTERPVPVQMSETDAVQWRDGRLYFSRQQWAPAMPQEPVSAAPVMPSGAPHEAVSTEGAVIEQQAVSIPVVEEPEPPADYIIGPNDVLFINVSGKPEFSSTSIAGINAARNLTGSRVDGNGDIQFPFVGTVRVGGLTLTQIQARLRELLQTYIKNPWVVVEVVEYKSHPLYLLGQFRSSGTFYMDRPLNLLQGIALGNGYDGTANLNSARLIRDKKIVPVDLYELLTKGDQTQNIWLRSGDTIVIPDSKNQQVFVFGAVKKPGQIPMPPGGLMLTQAIASAELRDSGLDFRHIRIIRSLSATRGELIVVDFDKMLRGEVLPFVLKQGDVIYVPKSRIGNWNDAIAEMLPSLQAFSALLQPFVNIKFLSR